MIFQLAIVKLPPDLPISSSMVASISVNCRQLYQFWPGGVPNKKHGTQRLSPEPSAGGRAADLTPNAGASLHMTPRLPLVVG